jgi:hypothetical protein
MKTFKAGDKVKYKHGGCFCNGDKVVTVREVRGEDRVYCVENNAWSFASELEIAEKPFDKALEELAKEVAIYEEKVNEFAKKVDELQVSIKLLEKLNEKY